MKKTLALILTFAMVLTLAACGGSNSNADMRDPETSETTEAQIAESTDKPDAERETEPEAPETTVAETEPEVPETTVAETEPEVPETTVNEDDGSNANANGIRQEFQDAMDAYEEFYAEYCDFMVKYKENPTDLSLLAGYASMMQKALEMDEAFSKWESEDLTDAELKYYLEVNNRVMQMLVDTMG